MAWYFILAIVLGATLVFLFGLWLFLVAPRAKKKQIKPFLRPYAHRGLWGGDLPENSLGAFRAAAEADFADCDAVLTQFETTLEAVLASKELAAKYGKPFILNPAPYVPVPEGLFDGVDLVTPNETEAEQFTGIKVETVEDCRRAAAKFFEMGVKSVVITLGVRGAYFTDGEQEMVVPSIRVKAVETTGAGDAFNGGLATAIAEGLPMETALQFATCTAALSVTRLGSSQFMPRREEIIALMEKAFGVEI